MLAIIRRSMSFGMTLCLLLSLLAPTTARAAAYVPSSAAPTATALYAVFAPGDATPIPVYGTAPNRHELGASYARLAGDEAALAAALGIAPGDLETLRFAIASAQMVALADDRADAAATRLPTQTLSRDIGAALCQQIAHQGLYEIGDGTHPDPQLLPPLHDLESAYFFGAGGIGRADAAEVEIQQPATLTPDAEGFVGPFTLAWKAGSSERMIALNADGVHRDRAPRYVVTSDADSYAVLASRMARTHLVDVAIGQPFYVHVSDPNGMQITVAPRTPLFRRIAEEAAYTCDGAQTLYELTFERLPALTLALGGYPDEDIAVRFDAVLAGGTEAPGKTLSLLPGDAVDFRAVFTSRSAQGTDLIFDKELTGKEVSYSLYEPIYSALQLDDIRKAPDKRYRLMNSIDMTTYHEAFGDWVPIPEFTGGLSGQYHAIKNLRVRAADGGTTAAMFETLSSASIGSLRFIGLDVEGQDAAALAGEFRNAYVNDVTVKGSIRGKNAAGIAVTMRGGTITKTTVMANLSGDLDDDSTAGGLVCRSIGGKIEDCKYENGTLTATRHIGGIVGESEGTTIYAIRVTSANMKLTHREGVSEGVGGVAYSIVPDATTGTNASIGGVVMSYTTIQAPVSAGGIVVYARNAKLTGCLNNGSVTVQAPPGALHARVGGVAALVENGTLDRCQNTGSLTLKAADGMVTAMGGIAAQATNTSIVNSVNRGLISADRAYASAEGNAEDSAMGGILGTTRAQSDAPVRIKTCYNAGSIQRSAYSRNANHGGISGSPYVSVENAFNLGNINLYGVGHAAEDVWSIAPTGYVAGPHLYRATGTSYTYGSGLFTPPYIGDEDTTRSNLTGSAALLTTMGFASPNFSQYSGNTPYVYYRDDGRGATDPTSPNVHMNGWRGERTVYSLQPIIVRDLYGGMRWVPTALEYEKDGVARQAFVDDDGSLYQYIPEGETLSLYARMAPEAVGAYPMLLEAKAIRPNGLRLLLDHATAVVRGALDGRALELRVAPTGEDPRVPLAGGTYVLESFTRLPAQGTAHGTMELSVGTGIESAMLDAGSYYRLTQNTAAVGYQLAPVAYFWAYDARTLIACDAAGTPLSDAAQLSFLRTSTANRYTYHPRSEMMPGYSEVKGISIETVDPQGIALGGARFDLYRLGEANEAVWQETIDGTSDPEAAMRLVAGRYRVVPITAATGCALVERPIELCVDVDGVRIEGDVSAHPLQPVLSGAGADWTLSLTCSPLPGAGDAGDGDDEYDETGTIDLRVDVWLVGVNGTATGLSGPSGAPIDVRPGDELRYRMRVHNMGDRDARYALNALKPTGLSFAAADNPEWTATGNQPTLRAALAAGEAAEHDIVLTASDAEAGALTMGARVQAQDRGGRDVDGGSQTERDSSAHVFVVRYDVRAEGWLHAIDGVETGAIAPSGDAWTVRPGATLTLRMAVTNLGNRDARYLLTDVLHSALEVSAQDGWSISGQTVTRSGALAAGARDVVDLVVTVAKGATGTFAHGASARVFDGSGAAMVDADASNDGPEGDARTAFTVVETVRAATALRASGAMQPVVEAAAMALEMEPEGSDRDRSQGTYDGQRADDDREARAPDGRDSQTTSYQRDGSPSSRPTASAAASAAPSPLPSPGTTPGKLATPNASSPPSTANESARTTGEPTTKPTANGFGEMARTGGTPPYAAMLGIALTSAAIAIGTHRWRRRSDRTNP